MPYLCKAEVLGVAVRKEIPCENKCGTENECGAIQSDFTVGETALPQI
jgi:hypothetical protein